MSAGSSISTSRTPPRRERFLGAGPAALRAEIDRLRAGGRGVVITWAAGDAAQLPEVRQLLAQGAAAVWCDSDRGAACRAHYAGARRVPRFEFVDTFEADGSIPPGRSGGGRLLRSAAGVAGRRGRRFRASGSPARVRVHLVAAASALAGAATATAVIFTGLAATSGGHHARPALALGGAASTHVAALPRQGVLVSNQSLAGIRLGDSKAAGDEALGRPFHALRRLHARDVVLLLPAAGRPGRGGRRVPERQGRRGLHARQPGRLATSQGSGSARSSGSRTRATRSGSRATDTARSRPQGRATAVASILTQGAAVYGFALTRPSVSPCH